MSNPAWVGFIGEKNLRVRRKAAFGSISMMAVLISATALASPQEAVGEASRDEMIVMTARHRDERAQDIPAGLPVGKGTRSWSRAAGTWFWIDPENDLYFIGMIQRGR